jgi:hypothetical protein
LCGAFPFAAAQAQYRNEDAIRTLRNSEDDLAYSTKKKAHEAAERILGD